MTPFYAFDTQAAKPVRVVSLGGSLYEMTEGEVIDWYSSPSDLIYLGEKDEHLLPLTLMYCFRYMTDENGLKARQWVDELTGRLNRWGLRCDVEDDTFNIVVRFNEEDRDDWTMEIYDVGERHYFFKGKGYGLENAKTLARLIIEGAIHLGVDLRTSWEFHRLDGTQEENQN